MSRAAPLRGTASSPTSRFRLRAAAAALALLAALSVSASARPRPGAFEADGDFKRAWTKNFEAETPKYRRPRDFDLERVRVELEPDLASGTIRAAATLSGKALAADLERLEFDAVGLSIERVEDAKGKGLEFDASAEKLTIHLPGKLKPGSSAEVTVRYTAEPKQGLYFFRPDERYPGQPLQLWSQGEPEEARHWIPIHDDPNERASTELVVTVPEGLEVLSNGRLKSKKPGAAGKVVWHWAQEKPHVAYLITLVVGKFAIIEQKHGALPVRYYVPPDRKDDALRSFGKTPDMIAFFEKRLEEPYPWDKYDQVALYNFGGGMENTSATSMTDRMVLDERARLDQDWVEDLASHELAHQWFGDLLTCKDWSHLWLNEGITSYFQALYREHAFGRDEFLYDMDRKARDVFGEGYERPIVTSTYQFPWAMFDGHTYDKGAWVLHMLRLELGEEEFWTSFKAYIRENRYQVVETEDLRRAVEKTTGNPMQEFFDQWLYGAGQPKLEVAYEWDAGAKKARLKVKQLQSKPFKFKLPVEFRSLLKTHSFKAEVEKAEHTFEWEVGRPRLVRVDPESTVLRELDLKLPLELLAAALERDPAVPARLSALRALKKAGSPKAQAAVERCLKEDAFWALRAECAEALAELGGLRSRDALIEATKQGHPKVRAAAASGLGRFVKDESAFAALKALVEDPSWRVRQNALSAMGNLKLEQARPVLEAALETPSWVESVRRGAISGLAALRDPAGLPKLRDWASPGKPVLARRDALSALAALSELHEEERTRDFLERIAETETDDWTLRSTIGALVRLGNPKSGGALSRIAARDPREEIRRQAQESLENIREGRKGKLAELTEKVDKLNIEIEKLWKKLDEKKK